MSQEEGQTQVASQPQASNQPQAPNQPQGDPASSSTASPEELVSSSSRTVNFRVKRNNQNKNLFHVTPSYTLGGRRKRGTKRGSKQSAKKKRGTKQSAKKRGVNKKTMRRRK